MTGGQLTETAKAAELYHLSPYATPQELVRAGLVVKKACALANRSIGALDRNLADAIISAIDELAALEPSALGREFPLDPFQGGAGTSFNMNLNESIAARAEACAGIVVDPLIHVNMHQSTNDVAPTALRIMLLSMLGGLETEIEALQQALQVKEQETAHVMKTARTELRDATVISAGREFSTWAAAVARDRWRIFKARERLKEVNIGGTAIGTGQGAPRAYIFGAIRELQRLVPFPVTRADNVVEATSNYDSLLEAMGAVQVVACNLRRTANDFRLLASGPGAGFGEIDLPSLLRGSSIMPGKVNPVIAEAVIQVAERIEANHGLIARLCSMSELQLNAFWPLIAYTAWESLTLARNGAAALSRYTTELRVNAERCARNLDASYAKVVALLPLFGYPACERFVAEARERGVTLDDYLVTTGTVSAPELDELWSRKNLNQLGYDEELYARIRSAHASAART